MSLVFLCGVYNYRLQFGKLTWAVNKELPVRKLLCPDLDLISSCFARAGTEWLSLAEKLKLF